MNYKKSVNIFIINKLKSNNSFSKIIIGSKKIKILFYRQSINKKLKLIKGTNYLIFIS